MNVSRPLTGFLIWFATAVCGIGSCAAAVAPDSTPILALIDVETTGLDPEKHEMIDIGAIYIEADGRELGRFHARINPMYPERADPGALAVNGFSAERWRSLQAISSSEAARRFEEFHRNTARDRRVVFTAFNVWFDQSFVSRWLAREGRSWRQWYYYQVLDLPSMAWARGVRGLTGSEIARSLSIDEETRDPMQHTGASGVDFNLAVYRALAARTTDFLY